ncbi:hypothetical protein SMATCC274_07740 [Serratia marcescens]|nr:hypothetical protein SMATCC274_07740 [Serratia marcescens]
MRRPFPASALEVQQAAARMMTRGDKLAAIGAEPLSLCRTSTWQSPAGSVFNQSRRRKLSASRQAGKALR